MDNLTHSLVGVALSRVYFKKRVVYATAAMVIAANLPDLDYLYSWPGVRYIEYHRGVLHSLWMMPVWALLVAFGLRWYAERKHKPLPAWRIGFLLGLAGVGSHLLLDWANAYGIRLLAPVSQRWFALDLMPTYDPFVWLLFAGFLGFPMLLTLISSEVGATKSNPHRISAALSLVLLVAWVGLRARQHSAALDLLNAPNVAGMYQGQIPYDWAALPTAASPYEWNAVVDLPGNVLVEDISSPWDTDYGRVHLERNYIRPPRVPAMEAAEGTHTGGITMWFARFPFEDVEDESGSFMVTITDMRFAEGVVRPALKAKIAVDGSGHVINQSFSW